MKSLIFKGIENVTQGTILNLLKESYNALYTIYDPANKDMYFTSWDNSDKLAFSNPDTVGKCIFFSFLDEELVGFISFDPRNFPVYGIVGQNCIYSKFKGKGYGKEQLRYLLDYFKKRGVKKALVSTGDSDFFIPAQKMYKGAGFVETKREVNEKFGYGEIFYEKEL